MSRVLRRASQWPLVEEDRRETVENDGDGDGDEGGSGDSNGGDVALGPGMNEIGTPPLLCIEMPESIETLLQASNSIQRSH